MFASEQLTALYIAKTSNKVGKKLLERNRIAKQSPISFAKPFLSPKKSEESRQKTF